VTVWHFGAQRDGLLVPPLTVSDYPEKQIGNKEEDTRAQADNSRIGECRVSREFGPSILFREGVNRCGNRLLARNSDGAQEIVNPCGKHDAGSSSTPHQLGRL